MLPEKWYIKRTPETAEIINEWFNDNADHKKKHKDMFGYLYYPEFHGADWSEIKKQGFVEVTFEQFMKEKGLTPKKFPHSGVIYNMTEDHEKYLIDFLMKLGYTRFGNQTERPKYKTNGIAWYKSDKKFSYVKESSNEAFSFVKLFPGWEAPKWMNKEETIIDNYSIF